MNFKKTVAGFSTLAFVASVAVLTQGCYSTPDCNDPANVGALNAGKEAARQRGFNDGMSLSYQQGKNEGYQAAYANAYQEGYNSADGYSKGYWDGHGYGYAEGLSDPVACNQGAALGDRLGFEDGTADGHFYGYKDGYDYGYDMGLSEGLVACDNPSNPTDGYSEDQNYCYNRGLNDAASYRQGLNEGKAANTVYQDGYKAGAKEGRAAGLEAGKLDGYSDGYAVGRVDGFNKGADEAYLNCYNDAYVYAYADAYDIAYYDLYLGFGEVPAVGEDVCSGYGGAGAGFCDGYNDGYDTCMYGSQPDGTGVTLRYGSSDAWKKAHAPYSGRKFPEGLSAEVQAKILAVSDLSSDVSIPTKAGKQISRKILRDQKIMEARIARGLE